MSFDVEPILQDLEKSPDQHEQHKQRIWDRWRRPKREEKEKPAVPCPKPQDTPPQTPQTPPRPGLGSWISKKVGVGIPRAQTFRRQEDEQRKNLEPVQSLAKERREVSRVRQRAMSAQPVTPKTVRRQGSAPEVGYITGGMPSITTRIGNDRSDPATVEDQQWPPQIPTIRDASPRPTEADDVGTAEEAPTEASYNDIIDEELRNELEQKWILNLSMQFRDKSPREKFFVTYAETPQKWRRVTVSIDYRNAPEECLEAELQKLQSQSDKNARIYESIRLSLQEIQFYDTVTNLKLETREDRLHVHVTEDVNEIISYPSIGLIEHLPVKSYRESELHFMEHMSGFVYKVKVGNHTWIKKEIPGPDSVEEFLYEINALSELIGSRNVIELRGLVVDEGHQHVKGLLIAYADQGALIDIIYDNRDQLSWEKRERWAKHIIRGLMEIHEGGFVQGDFTLSNIVVDGKNRAKIIDINRRGCPVGWEPPEIGRLIDSHQRISMFIGVKSDIFQLGMVLWALVMQEDEPERQPRPLVEHPWPDGIPDYLQGVIKICLSNQPAERLSCKDLLKIFPKLPQPDSQQNFQIGQQFQGAILSTNHELNLDAGEGHPTASDHETSRGEPVQTEEQDWVAPSPTSDPTENGLVHGQSDRGRSPTRDVEGLDPLHLSPIQSHNSALEPNIISISPGSDPRWAAMASDGSPYFIPTEALDSFRDVDGGRESVGQQRLPLAGQVPLNGASRVSTSLMRAFDHVDSGLADMDLDDNQSIRVEAVHNSEPQHFESNDRENGVQDSAAHHSNTPGKIPNMAPNCAINQHEKREA